MRMTAIDRWLPEHVVPVREKMLEEQLPDLLASQHALAGAYQANRKVVRQWSFWNTLSR
jgi:hypothetical protein